MASQRWFRGFFDPLRRGSAVRRAGSLAKECSLKIKRAAQTTVELMLVLPVFMMMLFVAMELGNIAHQILLFNHCAYELVRIGALYAGPVEYDSSATSPNTGRAKQKMEDVKGSMGALASRMEIDVDSEGTGTDPQSGQTNYDLNLTLRCKIILLFPFSNYLFATDGENTKDITLEMSMPIEWPAKK